MLIHIAHVYLSVIRASFLFSVRIVDSELVRLPTLPIINQTSRDCGLAVQMYQVRRSEAILRATDRQIKDVKRGISGICVKLCRKKPKPWKRNAHGEATQSSRYAYTQHRFYEQITL